MADVLVNIDVADLEEGVRFYCEGLGLELRRRLGEGIVELAGASCPVFLIRQAEGTRAAADVASPRRYERHWTPVHLDFVVLDLDTAVRRAEAAGAACEGELREFPGGRYRVLADPFGNGFCLLQFQGAGYEELATPEPT